MWNTRQTETYERRLKYFNKKHPRELEAMLQNLEDYIEQLQSGVHPRQIRFGFTHDETHGAIAIDQKGAPGKPTQTRLYIYPHPETQTLYLITIGDKKSQRDDNALCRELIVEWREEKPHPLKPKEPDDSDTQEGDGSLDKVL